MTHIIVRHSSHLLACLLVAAVGCGQGQADPSQPLGSHRTESPAELVQTCTVANIRGGPIKGTFCGGASGSLSCTAGALYSCNDKSATNNCALITACANGCLHGGATDACNTGPNPLQITPTTVVGGAEITATVVLAAAHPAGSITNMRVDRGDLVAAVFGCNVKDVPAGATSASFGMPTAVVAAPSVANVYVDLAYNDAVGQRELISPPIAVTLLPGGTEPPPPPIAFFSVTPPSIAVGGISFIDATLTRMAPISGVPIRASSSDPAIADVPAGNQPFVPGGCTRTNLTENIFAASHVPATTTVQISASTGAQVPLTQPLTVTAGCSPKTCLDLVYPACGGPDGCGGTLACGCPGGQTCGAGGTPGICADPPATAAIASFTLSPATVTGGATSTAAITLTQPAPAGGVAAFLSSSSATAVVPSSLVFPAGATSGTFPITTKAVTGQTAATITAQLGGTATATLTISPAGTPPPPPPPPPGSSTLTLSASGRSGVTITSSPAGLSVPVGSTRSASFANGTQVTLTASSGRTAVWSGACATSRDTQSCTFTISADASVTANVK